MQSRWTDTGRWADGVKELVKPPFDYSNFFEDKQYTRTAESGEEEFQV